MITDKIFKELFEIRDPHCVSMYVPSHQSKRGLESKSFFKRILADATEELEREGMDKKEAHRFLFSAYELLNEQLYWNNLNHDLGIFVAKGFFKVVKIPYETSPYFLVADRFYLRPLIPAVNGQSTFYVLALNEEGASLYRGDKFSLQPVGADEAFPENMQEALAEHDRGANRQSGQPAPESPIYSDNDGELGHEHHLKQLEYYFQEVDEGVNDIIEEKQAPLVIAAPDHMAPAYKAVSNYLDITPVHISGKVDESSLGSVHQKALEIVENYFTGRRQAQANHFREYSQEGRTSTQILEILPKAAEGKVESLFLARNKHSWGRYDEDSGSAELFREKKPKSIDLTGLAASYTHLNGGRVFIIPEEEMPQPSTRVNAIYRPQQ